ncbi:SRPBCC family protein [Xinfangfangia pollutisoli]|uniref:SRPBCC family protein n=1 Tax=Xinfangfangia pollutisoli TaxID=2865960 RepID=UPI001CD2F6D7|nr:SRPBCC family protein [Xinfangfangia pollutisoli]
MPVIKQKFDVNHPRPVVWDMLQDIPRVVGCVPGAALDGPLDGDKAKGRVTVKLGPVKANFGGEATISADRADWSAKIAGVGVDKSHASRAKGDVSYRLLSPQPGVTTVEVEVDYALSGSLAQVARGGIVEAVAEQICADFAANLEAEIAAEATPAAPQTPADPAAPPLAEAPRPVARASELNMVQIMLRVVRRKIARLFGRG